MFGKTHLLVKKNQNWVFWENSLFQSHSAESLLPLAISEKIKIFSWKTYLFLKKIKLWTLGGILNFSVVFSGNYSTLNNFQKKLLSQSNSAANLLHLAIMKKVKFFSRKASCFCQRKPNFVFFLKNFNISLAFCGKFSFFSDFMKIQLLFFRKTHVFFFKKTYFVHILRNFTVAI